MRVASGGRCFHCIPCRPCRPALIIILCLVVSFHIYVIYGVYLPLHSTSSSSSSSGLLLPTQRAWKKEAYRSGGALTFFLHIGVWTKVAQISFLQ